VVASRQAVAKKRDKPDPVDPLVKISSADRKAWKAKREKLELNTRQLGDMTGTSSGTVTNVETGFQQQLKLSVYVSFLRALFKLSEGAAQKQAESELKRQQTILKRLARATMAYDNDQLERWVAVLESQAPKSTEET
jgi:hypothetical protein